MYKRLLSTLLALCLVLTAVPLTTAYGATEPTEEEQLSLFDTVGFAGLLQGSDAEFDEEDNVMPYMAYWILCMSGKLEKYYNEETWCFELTYDQYLEAMDKSFVKWDKAEVKTFLIAENYYNPDEGDMVKIFAGGLGDCWAWEPLEIRNEGDTYYVDGLFLYGNEETGDVKEGDVEFFDYWVHTSTWTDENGKEHSNTYPMHIEYGLTVTMVNTEEGLKVAGYDETPCYTYEGTAYVQNPVTKEFDQSYTAKLGYKSTTYSGSVKEPAVTVVDKNG